MVRRGNAQNRIPVVTERFRTEVAQTRLRYENSNRSGMPTAGGGAAAVLDAHAPQRFSV